MSGSLVPTPNALEAANRGRNAHKPAPASRGASNPAPKLDCRAADRIVLNIDTPDTNWQPNVWKEDSQDQRSLALVRLLPGEPKGQHPEVPLLLQWLPKHSRA